MDADQISSIEYNALRAEILARLGHQNTAILGSLASLIALGAASGTLYVQLKANTELGVVLGIISMTYFLVGWYVVSIDRQIAQMGYYLETVLRTEIVKLHPTQPWLLGWDSYIHSRDKGFFQVCLSALRVAAIYGTTFIPGSVILLFFCSRAGGWCVFGNGYTFAEKCILVVNVVMLITGIYSAVNATRVYHSTGHSSDAKK